MREVLLLFAALGGALSVYAFAGWIDRFLGEIIPGDCPAEEPSAVIPESEARETELEKCKRNRLLRTDASVGVDKTVPM